MDLPKFRVGEKVFAKMKGYPPWPAIIEAIHDLTPGKIKYTVYFYGTRQVGLIKEELLFLFSEHKETLGKPRKTSRFNQSMKEAEADSDKEGSTQQLLASLQKEAGGSSYSENSGCSTEDLSPDTPCRGKVRKELGEKAYDSLRKEFELIRQILNIQKSLGVDEADFESALNSLIEIEDLDIAHNKMMFLKNREIVLTLTRSRKYHPTIPHSKEMLVKVQTAAQRILSIIQPLFPTVNGQSFVEAYEEELKRFNEITKHFTKQERLMLTDEHLMLCSSSQAGGN